MSETTAIGTCNRTERVKIGTVGPPAPGVEIRLAQDGEIEVRGDCVSPGYRNRPDLTAGLGGEPQGQLVLRHDLLAHRAVQLHVDGERRIGPERVHVLVVGVHR